MTPTALTDQLQRPGCGSRAAPTNRWPPAPAGATIRRHAAGVPVPPGVDPAGGPAVAGVFRRAGPVRRGRDAGRGRRVDRATRPRPPRPRLGPFPRRRRRPLLARRDALDVAAGRRTRPPPAGWRPAAAARARRRVRVGAVDGLAGPAGAPAAAVAGGRTGRRVEPVGRR